jgi:hypothetical protein
MRGECGVLTLHINLHVGVPRGLVVLGICYSSIEAENSLICIMGKWACELV